MKAYETIVNKTVPLVNHLALNVLIDKGRECLLEEKSYLSMIESIDSEKKNNLLTNDFQKEIVSIARNMAMLTPSELYEFIRDEKIS